MVSPHKSLASGDHHGSSQIGSNRFSLPQRTNQLTTDRMLMEKDDHGGLVLHSQSPDWHRSTHGVATIHDLTHAALLHPDP